ncbi:MAG: hypothetical protein A2096_09965 [Spirochaetes bacterium GWF1_41_5]|nr:MAG: hypothetical protein A2096_09965 [Spirochaetes bacterium GWF1_41_5]HBE03972.1 hypothetical protein [Spirochaetia bacterium]
MKKYNIGIIGCGDFLRCELNTLNKSQNIAVKSLYDLDKTRAVHYKEELGGLVVESETDIFTDKDIDIVLLFVPPWVRKDLLLRAVENKKNIITTKPLGPSEQECAIMKIYNL